MFATGNQIKAARALLGWAQSKLAEVAGVHRNCVCYWERQYSIGGSNHYALRLMRDAVEKAGVELLTSPTIGVRLKAGQSAQIPAQARAQFSDTIKGERQKVVVYR